LFHFLQIDTLVIGHQHFKELRFALLDLLQPLGASRVQGHVFHLSLSNALRSFAVRGAYAKPPPRPGARPPPAPRSRLVLRYAYPGRPGYPPPTHPRCAGIAKSGESAFPCRRNPPRP